MCTQGSVKCLPATWIIMSYKKLRNRALGKGRVMPTLLQRQCRWALPCMGGSCKAWHQIPPTLRPRAPILLHCPRSPSSSLKINTHLVLPSFPGCKSMGADGCFRVSFTCWLYQANLARVLPLLPKRKSPSILASPLKAAHVSVSFWRHGVQNHPSHTRCGGIYIYNEAKQYPLSLSWRGQWLFWLLLHSDRGSFYLSFLKSEIIPNFLLVLFMWLSDYKITFLPNL